ncbi:MAG: transposase [Planctomycetes bacterium]|nr:transposase [Planctomycetota bacterium]
MADSAAFLIDEVLPDVPVRQRVLRRVLRQLRRLGKLDDADSGARDAQDRDVLLQLHAAAVQGRTALGPNAGTLDSRPGRGTRQVQFRHGPGSLCADLDGFSLHAAVRVRQGRPDRLEHLIRYVARPPIAEDRLSILPDGRVAYAFKKRWRDGSIGVVVDPLTILERLAALVPRPRKKLVHYFGVFAPAAAWRPRGVPPPRRGDAADATATAPPRSRDARIHAVGARAIVDGPSPGCLLSILVRSADGADKARGPDAGFVRVRVPRSGRHCTNRRPPAGCGSAGQAVCRHQGERPAAGTISGDPRDPGAGGVEPGSGGCGRRCRGSPGSLSVGLRAETGSPVPWTPRCVVVLRLLQSPPHGVLRVPPLGGRGRSERSRLPGHLRRDRIRVQYATRCGHSRSRPLLRVGATRQEPSRRARDAGPARLRRGVVALSGGHEVGHPKPQTA